MDEALHLLAAWRDTPDLDLLEACACGLRWILAVPKRVREIDALGWATIQTLLNPWSKKERESFLQPYSAIEQRPMFRERQRRLRCSREGPYAHVAEWLELENACCLSLLASPTVRRETDPRRARLEHQREVALDLADRYLEMCEEGWFSD